MTDITKTGGPAFPHPEPRDPSFSTVAHGMTLRDWFAGQALAGLMANCTSSGTNGWSGMLGEAVKVAYRTADAMIAARGDA